MEPLSDKVFPRAIVHFDGDSFFASVEQALNHTLKGKPVITGAERGAATSVSYEAKRRGVTRSMTLREIREICPDAIVVSSDYTAYSLFARRMYSIVRRYTPHVEEYSIDECFADITGHVDGTRESYEKLAKTIQAALHQKLGITFGVGLAPTKVLAKTASKYRKPAGFTSIPAREAHLYLKDIKAGSLWGIGPSMAGQLRNLGIHTALQFASVSEGWLIDNHIAKPYRAIWQELRGVSISKVTVHRKISDAASIMKTRTFSPPSKDKAFIYSQLCKNIEKACVQARLMHMRPKEITFFLKTQDFMYGRREVVLPIPTNDPREILKTIEPIFEKLYRGGVLFRATGITLRNLVEEGAVTLDLFGEVEKAEGMASVLQSIDSINKRYGKETIFLGASAQALSHREPDRRNKVAKREAAVSMSSEQKKKTIDLLFLGLVH